MTDQKYVYSRMSAPAGFVNGHYHFFFFPGQYNFIKFQIPHLKHYQVSCYLHSFRKTTNELVHVLRYSPDFETNKMVHCLVIQSSIFPHSQYHWTAWTTWYSGSCSSPSGVRSRTRHCFDWTLQCHNYTGKTLETEACIYPGAQLSFRIELYSI